LFWLFFFGGRCNYFGKSSLRLLGHCLINIYIIFIFILFIYQFFL
jgi:hypothetical protein